MENFKGKYSERKFISKNQLADTYKAVNSITKEVVTLKVIINNSNNKEYMDNLKEKLKILKDMENPNLICINTIGNIIGGEKPYYYIESESFPGITLKEKLKDRTFNEEEAIKILKQVAQGLKEFHFKSLTYGKLSCDNIYIDEKGAVKVDTLAYLEDKDFTIITEEEFNEEEDIYSLGAILFELITGNHDFKPGQYKNEISDGEILYIIDKCVNKKLGIYEDLNKFIKDTSDYLEYGGENDDFTQEEILDEENEKKIPLRLIIISGLCIVVFFITTIIINGGSLFNNKKNEETPPPKSPTTIQEEKEILEEEETPEEEEIPEVELDLEEDINDSQSIYDNSNRNTSNNYYPNNNDGRNNSNNNGSNNSNNNGSNNSNNNSGNNNGGGQYPSHDTTTPEEDPVEENPTPDPVPEPSPEPIPDAEDENTELDI